MSRSATEWLALGDDLGLELAKVLTPGPWEHDWFDNLHVPRCIKCQCDDIKGHPEYCTAPDPIDTTDRNAAVEMIRSLFVSPKQQAGFLTELVDVCDEAPIDYLDCEPSFMLWLLFIANARELWIAAAMA